MNLLLVIAVECNLGQFRKMSRYCNHYYEKVTEAIKLKIYLQRHVVMLSTI